MAEWLFSLLAFLSSNLGLLIAGAFTALMILLWDWRFALATLVLVQLTAASAAVSLHDVPAQWALIQSIIVVLVCTMLVLSARAHALRPALRQSGTWVSRGLLLGMLLVGAWFMDIQIALPGMDPLVLELFVWLVLSGIILLGLSDHPIYNGIGLLMWLIPVQVVVTVAVPIPVIVAFVALLVLLIGLAVSYLAFVEHLTPEERGLVLTDLAFPQEVKLERPPSPPPNPDARRRLPSWVRRALPTPAGQPASESGERAPRPHPQEESPEPAPPSPRPRNPLGAQRKP